MTSATLFAPRVRYVSTGDSQFDAMMTWRAELELAYLSEDDTPNVLGGYADFLIIRVGEHPIDDLLDSLSQDAEHFAELFDGDDVADSVQEQFDDSPFNRILIITLVEVAGPLRGHDLGAWLVAEVISRMASPIDTLVLLYPHPIGQVDEGAEAKAVAALTRHWQRAGLQPVGEGFLGQATAYRYLSDARVRLKGVAGLHITVPSELIREETPDAYPRHEVIDGAGPQQGLRLVRD
ncbi:hypothetical protein [Mycolicibacterium fortuitum]|uniref:hypothetical protein n=1 Tax=Mycolicibacterium fortuitum TaxID=1766 RepID=UPI003AAAF47D